ncbi:hypothetical protein [Kribbella sp. NPDC051718]|uniref:hypothetical protein n=1 Tax=Kribbella sp. NPDC051718 TaxID=3155168 RepID=UPI003444659B
MPLSTAARAELSETLGDGYVVVDIKDAPDTANLLLTPVVSGTLLGMLRGMFPQARILFTELHDDGHGISLSGPLSRIVAQQPDGYYVAHALDALAPIVQSEARLQLSGSSRRTPPRIALSTRADETPKPPRAVSPPDLPNTPDLAEPMVNAVIWIDHDAGPNPPLGHVLDLGPIDDLVTQILGIPNPREDLLWAALTAECAIRMLAFGGKNVLVDVGGLAPPIAAELQIRISSEGVEQFPWSV